MVSVIIPLYNKEDFIIESIKSVLDQTFKEFEVIVINDGSNDGSLKISSSIKDHRVKIISIENSGVSIARNIGLQNAKYQWVAFLDADDWWKPTFLEEMINTTKQYNQHGIFASGRSHVFNTHIERYKNPFLPKDGQTGILNYFQVISKYLPLINSSNALIKKSLINEVGNFNKLQNKREDHDLWMRLSFLEKTVFVNKNLSHYRNTEEFTASSKDYKALDFCEYLRTIIDLKSNYSKREDIYFKMYCNRFVLLTYIKNYVSYSKEENGKVYGLAKEILTGKHLFVLKFLNKLPYKNTYPIFKFLRLNG